MRGDVCVQLCLLYKSFENRVDASRFERTSYPAVEHGIILYAVQPTPLHIYELFQLSSYIFVQEERSGFASLGVATIEPTLVKLFVQVFDLQLSDFAKSAPRVPHEHQEELVPRPLELAA